MSVFGSLKPQEQSLLWLAYVEGFDHREIASALQLKEGSIRVLLFRARKKLAGILRKRGVSLKEVL
jgi:RNA polymerase sigma-70 factor (ECF subfamily)